MLSYTKNGGQRRFSFAPAIWHDATASRRSEPVKQRRIIDQDTLPHPRIGRPILQQVQQRRIIRQVAHRYMRPIHRIDNVNFLAKLIVGIECDMDLIT